MTRKLQTRQILPLLLVLLALVPYTWIALRYSDLPQIGKYQDDGLLLIAGKSLKDSQGYRISSLPGKPFQTKYQPLYPGLLAVVWLIDDQFPENLKLFSALAWATFVAYLLLAFALFRSLGFSPWKSSGMLMLLALNPWLLYWALMPVSDLPAAVLVLAAFWILYRHRDEPRWWIVAGCVVAAACLTKSIGILMIPALWLGGWRGREWKRCLVMTAPALAAFAGWTVWASVHRSLLEHPILWYYTDYFAVHVKNGGLQALPQIFQNNLGSLIGVAGNSVVYNLADSMLGRFGSVVILAAAISGTWRLIRRTGAVEYPVFCVLLVLVLLLWDFSPNVRLLSPVLPMLAIGLCAEAEHARLLVRRAAQSLKNSDRIAAHLCRAGVVLGCVYALVLNVTFLAYGIPGLLDHDRDGFVRDRITFEWCKRELPSTSVVLLNYPWSPVFVVTMLIGYAALWKRRLEAALVLLSPVVLTLLASAFQLYPFTGRLLVFLLPSFIVATAAGAHYILAVWPARWQFATSALLAVLGGAPVYAAATALPPERIEHLRPILRSLATRIHPGDGVYVTYGAGQAILYYAPRLGLDTHDLTVGRCSMTNPRVYLRELERFRGRPRVWVLATHLGRRHSDLQIIQDYLDSIGHRLDSTTVPSSTHAAAEAAYGFLYDLRESSGRSTVSAEDYPVPISTTDELTARWGCYGTLSPLVGH